MSHVAESLSTLVPTSIGNMLIPIVIAALATSFVFLTLCVVLLRKQRKQRAQDARSLAKNTAENTVNLASLTSENSELRRQVEAMRTALKRINREYRERVSETQTLETENEALKARLALHSRGSCGTLPTRTTRPTSSFEWRGP